jgi:hypothetical protein
LLFADANLPRGRRYKPLPALAAAVLALGACGDGDGGDAPQTVAGPGFTFSAPTGWDVDVAGRSASASPHEGAAELVSVRVFRLARPYRPALWETVVPELDRVAAELAEQLGGEIESSAEIVVGGRRAKRYDVRYDRDGTAFRERTAFLLHARREFQLVCRYEAGDEGEGPRACAMLFSTFRIV